MTKQSVSTDKPLDKMTVKDLREVAKDIPEIVGVHGMNKAELLTAIKASKGLPDTPDTPGTPQAAKSGPKAAKGKRFVTVQDIKQQMRAVAAQEQAARAAGDHRLAGIYKQRRHRLKKQTRRMK